MCGVLAARSRGLPVDEEAFGRALDALAHHGPDGRGVDASPDGLVRIGHRRLAVRGPLHQPIRDAGGDVCAVNGELYGVPRPPGESDSAALLPHLRAHGLGRLEDLRGEFAFVWWSASEQVLYAVRDAFGVKPLVWCTYDECTLVASEVKALAAFGVPLVWDEEAVTTWIWTGLWPRGRTCFRGVRTVAPGHALRITGSGVAEERWWTPGPRETAEDRRPLDDVLAEAVRARTDADVPVAVSLSGGVDSSLVAAAAREHVPVLALSVGLGDRTDERARAEVVARYLEVPFEGILVSDAMLAEGYADTVRAVERPIANTHAVARHLLARTARQRGCPVLLTGDGGDELFAGYDHFRSDAGRPAGAGGVPQFVADRVARVPHLRRVVRHDTLRRHRPADCLAAVLDSHGHAASSHRTPLRQAMDLWSRTVLPDYLLPVLGDQVVAAHGVEGRPPLLDVVLSRHAAALPTDQLIAGGTDKVALRRAARRWLPEWVYAAPKQPFVPVPPPSARGGALDGLLQDTLRSNSAASMPFFSPRRLRLLLDLVWTDAAPADRRALDPLLHVALSLVVLGDALGVRAP